MSGGDRPPTHRVHWRAACDVDAVGPTFTRIHRTHESRVRQAGYCWEGGLMADRCHFGPRRLILEGEVDYSTRFSYETPRPAAFGTELAVSILQWTLRTLYGMSRDAAMGREPEPGNMRVEVRVRSISHAAA